MARRKTTHLLSKNTNSTSLGDILQTDFVIGVDEAGRGAWAGPVIAACVAWIGKSPFGSRSLNDSKKLSASHRKRTYDEILELAEKGKIFYGVGIIDNTMIDTVGIKEANRRAMQKALREIKKAQSTKQKGGLCILIDGRDNYSFDIPNLPKPTYVVRGDSFIPQIMAASILAKVTRDSLMCEFDTIHPGYGFARHKGYGTTLHQEKLQSLGVCTIHRRSYKPIRIRINEV